MTLEPGNAKRDRRELFRGIGRWSIMAGIFALGGWLGGRGRSVVAVCERAPVCRGCGLLAGCPLQRAAAERRLTPGFKRPARSGGITDGHR